MASRLSRYVRRFGMLKGTELYCKPKYAHGELTLSVPGLPAPLFLRARTSDRLTFQSIFVDDEFAFELDGQPKLIVDGGANVGYASIVFSLRYPRATIVAIEPESENFRLLERNTAPYPNIRRFKKGLWSHNERLSIENPEAEPYAYRVQEAGPADNTVEAITIGRLMDELGMAQIDLLKLDVEGAEKAIFADPDVDRWLSLTQALLVEVHGPKYSGPFEQAIARHPFRRERCGEKTLLIRDGEITKGR
jgi:FkbM family methyltransferase